MFIREEILAEVRQLNQQGLRVLGVAYKSGLREGHAYTVDDEGGYDSNWLFSLPRSS